MATKSLANLLLVDDSHYDVVLARVLLERANVVCNMTALNDGSEALAYLDGKQPYAAADPPDAIMLDLNMPGMNGFEVLAAMSQNGYLDSIPVIICSGSDSQQDIDATQSYGVAGYIIKPLDYEKLKEAIAQIPTLEVVHDGEFHHICRSDDAAAEGVP